MSVIHPSKCLFSITEYSEGRGISTCVSANLICSSHLITFITLLWTCYSRCTSLLWLGPGAGHSTLQVGSHKGRGAESSPLTSCPCSFYAAQGVIHLLICKLTLTNRAENLIDQHPQILLLKTALNLFFTQPVFVTGLAPTLPFGNGGEPLW